MDTLLLIDGNAIMHRAFHALPPFKTKDGIPTNVIYGFFSMLHKSIADFHPNFIVVCFDTPKPTFRNKLFKEYQAQRPKISDDFITQIPLVKEALDKAGVTHLEKDGFEADDLIGTITQKFKDNGIKVLILSGDRDIQQLVAKNVYVITPKLGLSDIKMYDKTEVQKKFGLDPDKIPDLKALMGDPSDNYPGAKGIGPKGAAKLLQEFGSLDKIYSNLEKLDEKTRIILKKYKKQVSLAKKLAKIDQQVQIKFDINSARFEKFKDDLKNYFLQYEMKSLVNRFFSTISNAKEKSEKKKNNSQMGLF
ncbi:hypothetical protein A3C98_01730 [Candidatus Roizmanbacteria bacterium RIFCSPHIGHO2_02_FULL_37_15]|uniref:5'-3' exonuclease domain-containing protein n=1 Tax=Candidatus Roizmanbacteria bacterium RIFCSPLOWO2_01_FULL_37_16 TaxID=1802058 RepID=A0A1F7ILN2_9BACT|nr:MAG: hypothetical protein A2859_00180 [Candidatus Roizmanbacteria bacterium RIFCSPHIGHO2_01_FULL_37_16b]OGK20908.1 MAG: hypothetical protein A3C98_01730 [Candidatus Roizmanbacteria bacterium RIFCSPHIGHO2_02_FULL_37_15]OGK33788.1 MAG: hypothetical protein A3F57_00910 [Candidatus Roizmanbacteria bacterium RIFCSPHIGHO2_12_FULL_36_11]OGK44297.1 MAG: hypothetical protein A3B40_01520 [Candidatus Roizmanbacteria bacterium RIFCSPLOWO2_01_FULL_37_16]